MPHIPQNIEVVAGDEQATSNHLTQPSYLMLYIYRCYYTYICIYIYIHVTVVKQARNYFSSSIPQFCIKSSPTAQEIVLSSLATAGPRLFWQGQIHHVQRKNHVISTMFNGEIILKLVGGLEHFLYLPFHIRDVILPIDELHHFSRWL